MAAGMWSGHWDCVEIIGVSLVDFIRQSVLFVSEDQEISGLSLEIEDAALGFGGKEDKATGICFAEKTLPVGMTVPFQEGPVIQTCPAEVGVIDFESQRIYEMKNGPGADAEAADGAGILGDFRSVENDVKRRFVHDFYLSLPFAFSPARVC